MWKFLPRILSAAGVFVFFILLFSMISRPSSSALMGKWKVTSSNEIKEVTLPFEFYVHHPQWITFEKTFSGTNVNRLVMPGVSCGGMRIYINGQLLYQNGHSTKGMANIWNEPYVIPIPSDILKPHNRLKIKLYALHDVGFSFIPFVGRYEKLKVKITLLKIFKYDILFFMMGMMMSIVLVFFTLSKVESENKLKYLLIAIASILVIVYLIDLTSWDVNNVSYYLTLRKMFVISSYWAITLFFTAFELELYNLFKLSKIFLALTLLTSLVVLVQTTVGGFYNSLWIGKLLVGVMILVLSIEIYSKKAVRFVYPITLSVFLMIFYFIIEIKGVERVSMPFGSLILTYSPLPIIAMMGIVLTENYYRNYSTKVVLYKESFRDPLTKVLNRKVLEEIRLSSKDVVVMVDLDNFKKINDTYGHDVGDELLQIFCRISEKNLRKGDLIIRYGGDEFIFVIKNCSKKDATATVERIRESLKEKSRPYRLTFSFGVERVTKDLMSTLKKADVKMYNMKKRRKKRSSLQEL